MHNPNQNIGLEDKKKKKKKSGRLASMTDYCLLFTTNKKDFMNCLEIFSKWRF